MTDILGNHPITKRQLMDALELSDIPDDAPVELHVNYGRIKTSYSLASGMATRTGVRKLDFSNEIFQRSMPAPSTFIILSENELS